MSTFVFCLSWIIQFEYLKTIFSKFKFYQSFVFISLNEFKNLFLFFQRVNKERSQRSVGIFSWVDPLPFATDYLPVAAQRSPSGQSSRSTLDLTGLHFVSRPCKVFHRPVQCSNRPNGIWTVAGSERSRHKVLWHLEGKTRLKKCAKSQLN